MRLRDQVALITGGSRGIGRAIALRYAREGARVVICGRSPSSLQEAEKEIAGLGAEAMGIPCDAGDDAQVRAMVRSAEARMGRIDILVSNAGYFPTMSPLHQMGDEEWDRTVRLNLGSAFYACRAVLPGMLARRQGVILLVSSIAAKAAYPYAVPYAASKAALLGMARALAAEVSPHGIRVNALCPGVVADTGMHDKVNAEVHRMSGVTPEQRIAGARSTALLRQIPTPEEVAGAAFFLACADSGMVTGQSMNVDGGVCFD